MPYIHLNAEPHYLRSSFPALTLSIAEVSRREGVSEMSLPNRRKQLNSESHAVSETSR